jgi:hypothetical protein
MNTHGAIRMIYFCMSTDRLLRCFIREHYSERLLGTTVTVLVLVPLGGSWSRIVPLEPWGWRFAGKSEVKSFFLERSTTEYVTR